MENYNDDARVDVLTTFAECSRNRAIQALDEFDSAESTEDKKSCLDDFVQGLDWTPDLGDMDMIADIMAGSANASDCW